MLSEEALALALAPATLADGSATHWPKSGQDQDDGAAAGKPVSYGFGWFLDPWEGHARMYHTGGTRGFRTVIERFTKNGLTIVVLCNRMDLEPEALAEKSAALILSPQTH